MFRPSIGAYRLLLWVIFPVITVYTATVAWRYRCVRYFLQRFAYFHRSRRSASRPLWFHCASVGETNTALPLIHAWLEHHPNDSIIITSNTPTASRLIKKQAVDNIRHCYLPLDYPSGCRRFLTALRPRCALIMETELWFNLFNECRKMEIPIFLLNARLSEKTLTHRHWLTSYYRKSLSGVAHIYTRTQTDAGAYRALGADPKKISIIGNLKYAAKYPQRQKPLLTCDYILAASTHGDEELQIAEAWRKARMPQLLVIVPRHPERGKMILRRLRKAKHIGLQLRSGPVNLHKDTKIYIVNTIGELPQWIAYAKLVFTGGSLVKVGGHNVLEPATLGVPQITGQFTQNFSAEVQALKENDGIEIVADQIALTQALKNYCSGPQRYRTMADNAIRHLRERRDILKRYLAVLSDRIR